MGASRTWLAVILACLVWFVYTKWFAPPIVPPVPAQQEASQTASSPGTTSGTAQVPSAGISTGIFGKPLEEVTSSNLTTGKWHITLSDVGGKISELRLLDFHEAVKKESPNIALVSPVLTSFNLGSLFSDTTLSPLGYAKFNRKENGREVAFNSEAGGVKLEKKFTFAENSYFIESTYHLQFPKGAKRDWGYLLLPVGGRDVQYDAHDPLKSWEVVYFQNDSAARKITTKLENGETVHQGNATGWLAFGNRYFATALVNNSGINPDAAMYHNPEFTGGYLRYPLVLKEGQDTLAIAVRIYAGPKDPGLLSQVPGLRQLIEYGMFSFFAYPMLEILRFFYRLVHNYGIAIILLTLVVRLAFYPLSMKSYKSMKSMQKLQPHLAALKEKHGDDKQKFSQEQMALFKTHKVNPAGGCLPMLVQLPIFLALYAVLGNSIELFHAPFFGWIHDLTAKDPLYIFPALMGLSMLLQQKMTPTAGMDPMQQKMMMFMPIMFTFLMISLPSGLTVYMFVSTLVGIAQQYVLSRDKSATTGPQLAIATKPGGAPEKI